MAQDGFYDGVQALQECVEMYLNGQLAEAVSGFVAQASGGRA